MSGIDILTAEESEITFSNHKALKAFSKKIHLMGQVRSLELTVDMKRPNQNEVFNAVFLVLINAPSLEFFTLNGGLSNSNAVELFEYLAEYQNHKSLSNLRQINVAPLVKQQVSDDVVCVDTFGRQSMQRAILSAGFKPSAKTVAAIAGFLKLTKSKLMTCEFDKVVLSKFEKHKRILGKRSDLSRWPGVVLNEFEDVIRHVENNEHLHPLVSVEGEQTLRGLAEQVGKVAAKKRRLINKPTAEAQSSGAFVIRSESSVGTQLSTESEKAL